MMIKLVIEEYLSSLKEKDELDILFSDLLKLDGYIVKNLPKTGERQYGVDLLAEKDGEVYLYVIKQGNLTRTNWDSGQNSVRQSINEIFDLYLYMMLPSEYQKKKKNIVFVTNGVISDAMRPTWESYKNQYNNENIRITEILLSHLVELVFRYAFNETLFDERKRSLLRKCLYYLDESDYKLDYFESMVNLFFEEIEETKTDKKRNKLFSSLQMMLSLVSYNALEKQRYRVNIQFAEYVLISIWSFIKKSNYFEDEKTVRWLNKFISFYVDSNERFIDNLTQFSKVRNGLPLHNPVEYRTLCFNILGFLCLYGIFLSTTVPSCFGQKYTAKNVLNLIVVLMNNNYGFYYPVYDNDGIEISLLFYLVLLVRDGKGLGSLIETYIKHIEANIQSGKYPILERQYSLAMQVEFNAISYSTRYTASYLWGVLLEWSLLIGQDKLSEKMVNYDFLHETTLQNWNCLSGEELGLYNKNEVQKQGYAEIFDEQELNNIKKVMLNHESMIDFEKFSFIEYSFPAIGLMLSRKYRIPVIPTYWRQKFWKYRN